MIPPARRAVAKVPVAVVAVVIVVAVVAVVVTQGSGAKSSTSTSVLCCSSPSTTASSSTSSSKSSTATTSGASGTSSSSSSASTSSSTSSQSSTVPATDTYSSSTVGNATFISDLNADVSGLDVQNLNYNDSFYQGNDFYSGPAGFAFDAEIQIIYNQCTGQCPTEVTNVTTIEPGFTVQVGLPVQATALGTTGEEFDFVVTVTPPTGNYNGQLVFYCTMAQ